MRYKLHALAFLIAGMTILTQTAAGMIQLGVADPAVYHAPNRSLGINVSITHDEFISQTSSLRIYLNDTLQQGIDLSGYLRGETYYSYRPHTFSYNVTASGTNTWEEYPDVTFDYSFTASGNRGTNCSTYWSSGNYFFTATVNRREGLKFVRNGSLTIYPPPDYCPANTTWSVTVTGIQQPAGAAAEVTARRVCGGGTYDGMYVDQNGWIFRELKRVEDGGECYGVAETTDRECFIHRFDNASLSPNFRRYGGPEGWPGGGVYRNDVYQSWTLNQVRWNGRAGYVRIKNYDYESSYFIVYLPPNGPDICAYTSYSVNRSQSWTRTGSVQGVSARYLSPYQRQWTQSELASLIVFPGCPCTGCNCRQTVSQYSVQESSDPDNAITVTFNQPALTVTGVCSLKDFTQNYTESIALGSYLDAPPAPDSYNLSARLFTGPVQLAAAYKTFHVCEDLDGDGYCMESGDCNDTDAAIKPSAAELCDYKDNDCDGQTDEDFYAEGLECVLGTPCNNWPGSVCNGTCMCTEDGLNVSCNSTYLPGELEEVCANLLDDDCDGTTDEIYDLINGSETEGCLWKCREGDKRQCSKDVGFCTPGYRTCVNGTWGACIGFREPREETCNLPLNALPRYADDDCDGIIDNVFGGTSINETKCQCYNGNPPKVEVCNGIDDDCDNEIDERICSCSTGETRFCGNDKGICRPGIQYCVDGYWETNCTGGVGPEPEEVCYNDLDDDCDGLIDEMCNLELTCNNGKLDLNEFDTDCGGECPEPCEYPTTWIIVAVIIMGFILLFIVLEIKGKIPA